MSPEKAEVSTAASAISPNSKHWFKSCISKDAQAIQGQTTGCHLLKLQLMGSAAVLPKPKHTWLPILTVLFLLSYGLMTMLVVEQGHTIDAQRNLIRQLFSDSAELTSMKGNANSQKQKALMQGPQAPTGQVAPDSSAQAAVPQGKDKHNMRKFVMPKPPRDASEMADERRSLMSI
jgi:hypothetical protein